MKLEQQVCSLELSKKLKELGVKQESVFIWMEYTNKRTGETLWELSGFRNWNITEAGDGKLSGRSWKHDWDNQVSAFTVAELGEIFKVPGIGDFHSTLLGADGWFCGCGFSPKKAKELGLEKSEHHFIAHTEANARAKMLIYLLENKLITL